MIVHEDAHSQTRRMPPFHDSQQTERVDRNLDLIHRRAHSITMLPELMRATTTLTL